MKQEHKHAKALRWMAEGQDVQARRTGFNTEQKWAGFPESFTPNSAVLALMGDEQWEFRIAPKTIKIGSREVEAPVLVVKTDQEVWFWSTAADEPRQLSMESRFGRPTVARGEAFASKEACEAMHEAITALVLEQCK